MQFRVEIHLLPEEYSRLAIDALTTGLSPGELLRLAYFDRQDVPRDDPAPAS